MGKTPKIRSIGDSPLLNNEMDGGRIHSTIHPDKLDISRFSEMRDQEESSLRIILYVVIVIVLGVGAALGVRYFLLQDDDSSDDETSETTNNIDTIPEVNAVNVDTVASLDSQASNQPNLTDFIDSELVTVGSSSTSGTGISVEQINYKKFTTFSRFTFTMNGVQNSLPQTQIAYDSNAKTITLTFDPNSTFNTEIPATISINDLATRVDVSTINKTMVITLSEDSKYRVLVDSNRLIIDIKTLEQIALDEQSTEDNTATDTETDTGVETPATTTDPSAPAGRNITNNFSQTKQFITNPTVTGNTIAHNQFYYEDTPEFFEFAWGIDGNAGDAYIPNATAELVETGGKVYIDVTISNLSSEAFGSGSSPITGTALTTAPIDLSAANFVRVDRVSFSGGNAKYRIELKRKADFKLVSAPTVDGRSQVVAIQIKD